MRPLSSALENRVCEYDWMKEKLQEHQFALGGNWDYDHGFYDRFLDDERQVWLRIPFYVVAGRLAGDDAYNPDTSVRIGTPLVLKHKYEEGLDQDAMMHVTNALFDQFQAPTDRDASVEDHWVKEAQSILGHLEKSMG